MNLTGVKDFFSRIGRFVADNRVPLSVALGIGIGAAGAVATNRYKASKALERADEENGDTDSDEREGDE